MSCNRRSRSATVAGTCEWMLWIIARKARREPEHLAVRLKISWGLEERFPDRQAGLPVRGIETRAPLRPRFLPRGLAGHRPHRVAGEAKVNSPAWRSPSPPSQDGDGCDASGLALPTRATASGYDINTCPIPDSATSSLSDEMEAEEAVEQEREEAAAPDVESTDEIEAEELEEETEEESEEHESEEIEEREDEKLSQAKRGVATKKRVVSRRNEPKKRTRS